MSWISRFIVRTGKAVAAGGLLALTCFVFPCFADAPLDATYQQQTIRFIHISDYAGLTAIGVEDPGLQMLMRDTGAVLTWKPGERYVLITTAAPTVVSFAVGDRRYDVGPISLQASFAPFQQGDEVYLPLQEVLSAFDLALRQDGGYTVLQPQLATLDVRAGGGRVTMIAHGGAPLRPRIVGQNGSSIAYEFDGVGTTLAGTRPVNAGGVRSVTIAQTGTLRDPKVIVTVQLVPGAIADAPRSNDERDVVLGFSGGNAAPAPAIANVAPPAQYAQGAAPAAPSGPATVNGVTVTQNDQGYAIAVAVTGDATFEWHRLRDPDNRFWVDIKNAQIQGAPIDQREPDPIGSLRVRQVDPTTVRIALSLSGPKSLVVSPSTGGLTIDIGRDDVADAARTGGGSVGSVVSVAEQAAPVTPAPIDEYGNANAGAPADSSWKFGGQSASSYVPTNPRLIVIDPGHGGSDTGAIRNGTTEAYVNLDTAKRLRTILIARGWQVRMTRETDVDVYAPNDTAHEELQARDDVANNAGARLLISLHANSFINSGPYGTTCYISKSSDMPLARIIERELESDGTKDDGIVKSHLYITLHALMPAVLIETAFLSNPNDYALLTSPEWREKIAESIADGIGEYAREYPVSNQAGQ